MIVNDKYTPRHFKVADDPVSSDPGSTLADGISPSNQPINWLASKAEDLLVVADIAALLGVLVFCGSYC